jgi:hypothetical protein
LSAAKPGSDIEVCIARPGFRSLNPGYLVTHIRHPEVLDAKRRASKDDGPSASAGILRGPRYARPPQDDGQQ